MKHVSVFNHVLGPVMRGPSSSHTAGAYHIARTLRSLCSGTPERARFAFDPAGSYGQTYAQQGADRAFAMGLLGRPLTDEAFFDALDLARQAGLDLGFERRPLPAADHPNTVEVQARAGGAGLRLTARSTGGGAFDITALEGFPVHFDGSAFELALLADPAEAPALASELRRHGRLLAPPGRREQAGASLVLASLATAPEREWLERLRARQGVRRLLLAEPVYFVPSGEVPAWSAAAMAREAAAGGLGLGRLALLKEARLLGLEPEAAADEMLRRWRVMEQSVRRGLDPDFQGMQLLGASAGRILRAEAGARPPLGGPGLRAAARAMAVMHVNGAMGVVCAAPTGGSAGTLPGALATLQEDRGLDPETLVRALFAAGAVGAVVAQRATFAAEVAGCQVEIGAAGAMAAAAVVEAVGGSAEQAFDAAAIAFQNTMGLVCDPVAGMVEIPCHTRNAAAAANAFLCADLALGGYRNPVPLDETIDAVAAVGAMMPSELRCTARGGLSMAPSARALAAECASCRLM